MDFTGVPGIHLNSFLRYDFLFGPVPEAHFGPATLAPTLSVTLPTSILFMNTFVRFQTVALSPNAANGSYAATSGHDVLFL